MKCPSCLTGINVSWDETEAYPNSEDTSNGVEIHYGECPECNQLLIKLVYGHLVQHDFMYSVNSIQHEELVYPSSYNRPIEQEVPESYRNDYLEATAVISISPKASAAISRRILQTILREEYQIQYGSLAQEIDGFMQLSGIPSHLSNAVDAIRNVGNFAAHPLKDTNTREIVDVEPGEAEWLLDVLDALFDFTFVQPKRLEERKEKLNEKLESLGKPPMKE